VKPLPRPLPHWLHALLLAAALLTLPTPRTSAELPPLLPRTNLFAPAEFEAPLISPDGTRLAWIAATNGLPNLWVRSVTTNDARILSLDPRGSVQQPAWQLDSQAVLYLQDSDGLGTPHLMQAHVGSGNIRDLTPFTGVQGRLIATSPRRPHEILAALNLRNRREFDVFRIDVRSGALGLEAEAEPDTGGWHADDDLNLRLAQTILPNGEFALATRPDPRSTWRPILRWGPDDSLGRVIGFGPGGSNAWIVTSIQAPAPRLLSIRLDTGATTIAAQDPRYDVSSVLLHPSSNTLEAIQIYRSRAQWHIANPALMADFEAIRKFRNADVDVLSRDLANRWWTISLTSDTAPVLYALYDRESRRVTPLFSERPRLEGARLAGVRPISFKARDGMALEGYLTLPQGVDPKNLPTVVLVHAGPWSRAAWGLDPEAQWLANRGYAVLQVNFRGSTGYGKDHLNDGNQEWGGKILTDLVDGRNWVVSEGYADPARIAILGSGFGGYTALAALAFHPREFAAGVSLAGPPSLPTLLASVPPNASALRTLLEKRVGHPVQDAEKLRLQSPISRAAAITAPLLAATTGRDPQIDLKEMDRFVAAIRAEGHKVEYLYFPDETATLRDPANRLRFAAAAENFLHQHLGGRVEPTSPTENYDPLRR
jgi:dipeptidyl aminopeptidase/acylaminoacyl peptidase